MSSPVPVRRDAPFNQADVRLTTPDGPFFQEIQGDALPSAQIDVGTVSKFIRNQTASAVRIDALWFERAGATD